jgi:hypothetical protein
MTSHHVMGMGFVVITDPDDIGTPSESVEFCGMHSLQESSAEDFLEDGTSSGIDNNDGGDGSESSLALAFTTAIVTVMSSLM